MLKIFRRTNEKILTDIPKPQPDEEFIGYKVIFLDNTTVYYRFMIDEINKWCFDDNKDCIKIFDPLHNTQYLSGFHIFNLKQTQSIIIIPTEKRLLR